MSNATNYTRPAPMPVPKLQPMAGLKPPYPPQTQSLGAPPSPMPDVPVSAVFLGLFLMTSLLHMRLFRGNRQKERRFVFSAAIFAFCWIRVAAASVRISWAYDQHNVRLALAAEVLVAVGTVILFIINLFFSQRLMRARHPHIGWHAPFKALVPWAAVGLTVLAIFMAIVVVVQSFYTLDATTLAADRGILWFVLAWFLLVAFLPIPIILVMMALPRRVYMDKFGAGRFRTKVVILSISSALLTMGAGFRLGTSVAPATPLSAPMPGYLSKACFYCFDFLVEFLVVFAYVVVRVDRRFYIPDGSDGECGYSADVLTSERAPNVYTINSDGQTMSLANGMTVSTSDVQIVPSAEVRSYEEAAVRSMLRYAYHRDSDTASVPAPMYMQVDRDSGRWELKPASSVSEPAAQATSSKDP